MIITNKLSNELLKAIELEARSHIAYDPEDIMAYINSYLKEHYRIYIKTRTHQGQTTYYDTLAFYADCPDYKLSRRRYFLNKYGSYFNCIVIPVVLLRQLNREYADTPYYMNQICRIHKARHIIKNIGGCQSLIFHSERQCQLFKLKYSEYL